MTGAPLALDDEEEQLGTMEEEEEAPPTPHQYGTHTLGRLGDLGGVRVLVERFFGTCMQNVFFSTDRVNSGAGTSRNQFGAGRR